MGKNHIIREREDNWKKLDYKDTRYLDAIASIFDVLPPCASVKRSGNMFKISYNKDATNETIFIVDLIKKSFYKQNFDQILAIYCLFNNDLHDVIKGQQKVLDLHKFLSLSKTLLKSQLYKKIKPTAAEVKISTTSLKNPIENYKINIKNIEILTNEEKTELESSLNNLIAEKNNKSDHVNNLTNLILNLSLRLYKNSLNDITVEDELKLREAMIRPIQDVKKIEYLFQETEFDGANNYQYVILSNPMNLHTETNQFILSLDRSDYTGISKLCCGLCDLLLSNHRTPHRGTHGIYDIWQVPKNSDYEVFKAGIDAKCDSGEYQEVGAHKPPFRRELSMDNFEDQISELHELKSQLGLIGDQHEEYAINTE